MNKSLTVPITAEQSGKTVSVLLRQELHFTRRQISQLKFRENGILLNGCQARVNQLLQAGDLLEIRFEESRPPSSLLLPAEGSLDVLYEDGDVLAVSKPPTIPTHPSGRYYQNSLCNLVLAHALDQGEDAMIRPVGRLDLETSGIVLFAKSQVAAARLFAQRKDGRCQKTYLALAEGQFLEKGGCIREPVGPGPGGKGRDRIKMQVCPEGKSAVTFYEVVRQYSGFALIRLCLGTGRTHQIRVHMAWLGHPLLGDQLYNSRRISGMTPSGAPTAIGSLPSFGRAALHAGQLSFIQPFTGESLTVQAPFPEDFRNALTEQ